jgi:high affinity sulfate transporter 1
VNHIEKGINPSSVNQIYFSGDHLLKGARIGIVAGMIALTVRQLCKPSSFCPLKHL